MTKINVSSNLPPYNNISPSCIKYYKPLVKKKKKIIDTDDIGAPSYNMLLDLLKCQVKHPNNNISNTDNDGSTSSSQTTTSCKSLEKKYMACHAGIMGVGNYKGRRHCGDEMEKLFLCVNSNQ